MLNDGGSGAGRDLVFKSVTEAGWALQSQHDRFLFKKARRDDHPSRVAWVDANNLWQAQRRRQSSL